MKKAFVWVFTILMIFSFAACGGSEEASAPADQPAQSADTAPPAEEKEPEDSADLSGYLGTKTGKFYSRFADGKMYMKYEMDMEGQIIQVISATDGEKVYSESILGGVSAGVTVMEGDTIYVIDHNSKMVMKMSNALTEDVQNIAGTIVEESDVNMEEYAIGTRTIEGKTYDTEEWTIEGVSTIMCFDGDDLKYMISAMDGMETVIKVAEVSDKVDDKLFAIPSDYQMMEL